MSSTFVLAMTPVQEIHEPTSQASPESPQTTPEASRSRSSLVASIRLRIFRRSGVAAAGDSAQNVNQDTSQPAPEEQQTNQEDLEKSKIGKTKAGWLFTLGRRHRAENSIIAEPSKSSEDSCCVQVQEKATVSTSEQVTSPMCEETPSPSMDADKTPNASPFSLRQRRGLFKLFSRRKAEEDSNDPSPRVSSDLSHSDSDKENREPMSEEEASNPPPRLSDSSRT